MVRRRRHAVAIALLGLCCEQGPTSDPVSDPVSTPAPAPEPEPEPEPEPVTDPTVIAAAHAAIQQRQLGEPLADSPHVHPVTLEQPEALASFHAALRRLEAGEEPDGKVRILVWGSSSTAGDRFTGYLRGYLQHRFGDGGPGFVAIVPLWRWHRHQEVDLDASRAWVVTHSLQPRGRSDGRYGLMGVRATGRYRGTRTVVTFDDLQQQAERWTLWILAERSGGSLRVTLDDGPGTVVETAAATIAPAYVELSTDTPHRRLEARVEGDGPVRLFGAVIERAEPGVVLDELGIGGSGARRVLHWDEAIWTEQVARRDPELVALAFGGIESMRDEHDPDRFERELTEILARLRRAAPTASCLVISPQDLARKARGRFGAPRGRMRPASMDSIMAVERRVAAAQGCAFFDTHALMGGPGSMPTWVAANLGKKDHVHFTARGYAQIGRALADAIMRDYDRIDF